MHLSEGQVNKETIRSFLAWLDKATEAELEAKRMEIQAAFPRVSSREGGANLNLALRLLEALARLSPRKLGER